MQVLRSRKRGNVVHEAPPPNLSIASTTHPTQHTHHNTHHNNTTQSSSEQLLHSAAVLRMTPFAVAKRMFPRSTVMRICNSTHNISEFNMLAKHKNNKNNKNTHSAHLSLSPTFAFGSSFVSPFLSSSSLLSPFSQPSPLSFLMCSSPIYPMRGREQCVGHGIKLLLLLL